MNKKQIEARKVISSDLIVVSSTETFTTDDIVDAEFTDVETEDVWYLEPSPHIDTMTLILMLLASVMLIYLFYGD